MPVNPTASKPSAIVLTPREREVLNAFVEHKNDKLVAQVMGLRFQTIHNYMAAILSKLGFPSRTHLIATFATEAAGVTG